MEEQRLIGLRHVQHLLDTFNTEFTIDLVEAIDNDAVLGLKQLNVTNGEFLGLFITLLNDLIAVLAPGYTVIYDDEQGLVIAKEIISTSFSLERF